MPESRLAQSRIHSGPGQPRCLSLQALQQGLRCAQYPLARLPNGGHCAALFQSPGGGLPWLPDPGNLENRRVKMVEKKPKPKASPVPIST